MGKFPLRPKPCDSKHIIQLADIYEQRFVTKGLLTALNLVDYLVVVSITIQQPMQISGCTESLFLCL